MKLLCTGDWHAGAGSEYGRRPGDRLRDQRDVVLAIADLAIEEAADGVLIAGDLLEGPAMLPEHLEVITAFIDRLQGRVPVLATLGNGKHDLALRETNGLAIFNHVDGIQVSSQPDVFEFAGCAIATLPWVSPARLIASKGGGDRDEIHAEVAQLLVDIADHARADCRRVAPNGPAILLGHWSVSGSSLPNGLPVDQLREPVIPIEDLEALGFDAIVMGHIHKPAGLGSSHGRHVLFDAESEQRVTHGSASQVYVGSPMPLNHGEAHTAHGVWILDLPGGSSSSVRPAAAADGESNGKPAVDPRSTRGSRSTFHPIASRPFVTLDIDITGDEDTSGLAYVDLGHAANGHDLTDAIVRFRYRATADQARRIDVPLLRRELMDAGAAVVKVQPDIVRADRARVAIADEQLDELAALDLYIDANGIDQELADWMRGKTAQLLEAAAA